MVTEFKVRFGRNYKVVLAIVLPGLLVAPLIMAMQLLPDLEEWQIWLIIFSFLTIMISFSVWMALRVYPPCVMRIDGNRISMTFNANHSFRPADFSFYINDITFFERGEIRGDEFYVIRIRNPRRTFQLSADAYEVDAYLSFNQAMVEISEKINAEKGKRGDRLA